MTCRVHAHIGQKKNICRNSDQEKDKSCLIQIHMYKPLIALYIAPGCLYGQCAYFLVVKHGRKYVLNSQVHLKTHIYDIFLELIHSSATQLPKTYNNKLNQRALLTNDSGLVVHTEPNTSNSHLLCRNNYLHSLRKKWCSTMILNQGTIVVHTCLSNAWLNTPLCQGIKTQHETVEPSACRKTILLRQQKNRLAIK